MGDVHSLTRSLDLVQFQGLVLVLVLMAVLLLLWLWLLLLLFHCLTTQQKLTGVFWAGNGVNPIQKQFHIYFQHAIPIHSRPFPPPYEVPWKMGLS